MRLSNKELAAILEAFNQLLAVKFSLYLFGSRTDDSKKGGDIDLLLVVEPGDKDLVVDLKTKIRLKIFESIPEQRIDITVATDAELNENEFFKTLKLVTLK